MRIDLLADLLAAAKVGTPGKDIFEEEMPADVKAGVLLKLPLQGVPIDHELRATTAAPSRRSCAPRRSTPATGWRSASWRL